MERPGDLTFRLTEQAILSFAKMEFKERGWKTGAVAGVLLTAFFVVLNMGSLALECRCLPPAGAWLLNVPIAVVSVAIAFGLIVAAQWLLLARMAAKDFAARTHMHGDHLLAFHDCGMRIQSATSLERYEWSKMDRLKEDQHILAVFQNKDSAVLLPKDQLGEATVAYIRRELAAAGVPNADGARS